MVAGRRWLVVLLVVVVVLVGAGVAAVVLLESDWAKRYAAQRVSAALGRDLTIGGGIDVDWSLSPRFSATELELANAGWSDAGPMAQARRLAFRIDLPALVRGRLILPDIHLDGLRLRLERSTEGAANWRLGGGKGAGDGTTIPIVRSFRLRDTQLEYRDLATDDTLKAKLDSVAGSIEGAARQLTLQASGRADDRALELSVETALAPGDGSGSARRPVRASVDLGETRARLEGETGKAGITSGLDAKLLLEGPNPAALPTLGFLALPPGPPYRVEGRLINEARQWRLESFQGVLGDSELQGDAKLTLGGERPAIEADLSAPTIDLAPLFADQGAGDSEAGGDESAISAIGFRGELLRSVDARIRLTNDRLLTPALTLTDSKLDVSLQAGHLVIDPFELGIVGGTATGNLDMRAGETPIQSRVLIDVKRLDLRKVLEALDLDKEGVGIVNAQADLSGPGDTLRAFLANAGGDIAIVMQQGRLDRFLVQLARQDVTGVVSALSGGREGTLKMRCLIVVLGLDEGLMRVRRLLIDTPNTRIVGDGSLDLAESTVDMKLLPRGKDFSLLSGQAPVHIRGPLSAPKVVIDESAMVGSLLTPIELGVSDNADCQELAQAARKAL